jgi:glycosyltransferase involved in cell wall biosynthesis
MAVSIVLPCFNPPEGWASNIIEQYTTLTGQISDTLQVILVNDGSTAALSEKDIHNLQNSIKDFILVSYSSNKGKGNAIREGVKKAAGDIIIYTDIDFPYTNDSIVSIYQALKSNSTDIAIGVKNQSYYEHVPPARRAISKGLRWMIKTFFTIPFTDTQCGLKGFQKHVSLLFVNTSINRYLFDLEFIRSGYKKKYRIQAIPVELKDGIQFRKIDYRILIPELYNLLKLMVK